MKHFVTVAGVTYEVNIEKVGKGVYSARFDIGSRSYDLCPLYSVENAMQTVMQEIADIYPELVACNAEPAPRWMRIWEPARDALQRWNNGEPLPVAVSPVKWRA